MKKITITLLLVLMWASCISQLMPEIECSGYLPAGHTVLISHFDQDPESSRRYLYEVDQYCNLVNVFSDSVPPPDIAPISSYWVYGTFFDFDTAFSGNYSAVQGGNPYGYKLFNSEGVCIDSFQASPGWSVDIHELTWTSDRIYFIEKKDTVWGSRPIRHFAAVVLSYPGKEVIARISTEDYIETHLSFHPDSSLIEGANVYHFNSFAEFSRPESAWYAISSRHHGIYLVSGSDVWNIPPGIVSWQHDVSVNRAGDTLYLFNNRGGDYSDCGYIALDWDRRRWSYTPIITTTFAPFSASFQKMAPGWLVGKGGAGIDNEETDVEYWEDGALMWSMKILDGISYRARFKKTGTITGIEPDKRAVIRSTDWLREYNLLGQEK